MALQLQPLYRAYSPNFDKLKTEDYILSILFTQDGFSFGIYDDKTQSCLYVTALAFTKGSLNMPTSLTANMKANAIALWWEKEGFKTFKAVNSIFSSRIFTLIPKPLYRSSAQRSYLEFNFALTGNDKLFTDQLLDQDAINIFAVEKSYVEMVERYYASPNRVNDKTILAKAALKEANGETKIYCYIESETIVLLAVKAGELHFVNSFDCKTKEDFTYYTLLCYKQLGISPKETPLVLAGHIFADSEIYHFAQRYITKIQFVDQPSELSLGAGFEDLPPHLPFLIYNSFLCV